MKRFKVTGQKVQRARELRRHATPAERQVWRLLRNRNMLGLKFRRQQVIRGLIVDFFCAELNLVLEVDGPPHEETERAQYDKARTAYLEAHGFRVGTEVRQGQANLQNSRARRG